MADDDLPVEESDWDPYIGPNGIPRIYITAPSKDTSDKDSPGQTTPDKPAPTLPVERSNHPMARPEPDPTPNYIMAPDLMDTQQDQQNLPPGIAVNDAGIPFNKETGAEIPTVQRPNVLPVARTPDGGFTLAMPKMLDLASNVMAPLAAPSVATKAGEVVLGSGAVKTATAAPAAASGPFYSTLEQAVNNSKLTKGSADQWLGYLKNQPGVKSEEINTVLGDLPKGQITKDQLGQIVQDNKVQLGEVNKGTPEPLNWKQEDGAWIAENGDWIKEGTLNGQKGFVNYNKSNMRTSFSPTLEQAKRNIETAHIKNNASETNTKFHSYQLPGGENYSEKLLTLPPTPKIKEAFEVRPREGKNPFGVYLKGEKEHMRSFPTKEEADAFAAKQNEHGFETSNDFKSSHWDEPNVLAHIRMNDRTVENTAARQSYNDYEASLRGKYGGEKSFTGGANINTINKATDEEISKLKELGSKVNEKSLHLEEIQSDWHQKGRKEGYKLSDAQRTDLDTIENKLTKNLTEAEIGNPDIDNVLKVAVDKKVISADEARNYKDYVKGENSTVPDAPFKKNWDELALKRMLHKAATEGYHGLSWTPGEAQAARYDLSKQIQDLHYVKNDNGTFDIMGTKQGEGAVVQEKNISQSKLADTIGKEVAEKIIKGEGVRSNLIGSLGDGMKIENADLKIGGEGMKAFYDKMLVDKANSLVKKYGSKVELNKEIPMSNHTYTATKGPTGNVHYLPITDELRAKAKSGFPLFSSTPTLTPISHNPFDNQDKKYKLTPVPFNPFAGINELRNNGGRADLNRPISPGPPAHYGLRPPIMDEQLPEFNSTQPNSLE